MTQRIFITGAVFAGLAVISGAFAAHGLKQTYSEYAVSLFETRFKLFALVTTSEVSEVKKEINNKGRDKHMKGLDLILISSTLQHFPKCFQM